MTAKAGEHRTIRLPEELVKRIDSVRGSMARERWIRALLYRVTGDLLVGSKRRIVLEFGPDGALLDGPQRSPPIETRHGLATVVAHAEAVSGRAEAEQAVRTIPPPGADLPPVSEAHAEWRMGQLKRNQAAADTAAGLDEHAAQMLAEAAQHDRNEARLRGLAPPAPRLRLKRPEAKP